MEESHEYKYQFTKFDNVSRTDVFKCACGVIGYRKTGTEGSIVRDPKRFKSGRYATCESTKIQNEKKKRIIYDELHMQFKNEDMDLPPFYGKYIYHQWVLVNSWNATKKFCCQACGMETLARNVDAADRHLNGRIKKPGEVSMDCHEKMAFQIPFEIHET